MTSPDDFEQSLRDQLSAAIGAEPPMKSLPHEDAARGRRLERRHRWTTVGATAAAVPALALGAYAVSGSFGAPPGGGTTVELQPAEGGRSAPPTESPNGTVTADCSTSPQPTALRGQHHSGASISVGSVRGFSSASGSSHSGRGAGLSASSLPSGPGARPAAGSIAPAPSSDSASPDCQAVAGPAIDSPEVDRVTAALTRHVDASGSHAGMTIAGGSVGGSDNGDKPSGIYVGYEWTDGNGAGMVSVSVEDGSQVSAGSCADPSVVDGPSVTCETKQLPDGTTVLVGRGSQDGAERMTVRYERPDGTVVWVTSDEATEQWWTDHSAATPLTAPPASVEQLINLALDPDVRL